MLVCHVGCIARKLRTHLFFQLNRKLQIWSATKLRSGGSWLQLRKFRKLSKVSPNFFQVIHIHKKQRKPSIHSFYQPSIPFFYHCLSFFKILEKYLSEKLLYEKTKWKNKFWIFLKNVIISAKRSPLLDIALTQGSPNTLLLRHPHISIFRNLTYYSQCSNVNLCRYMSLVNNSCICHLPSVAVRWRKLAVSA